MELCDELMYHQLYRCQHVYRVMLDHADACDSRIVYHDITVLTFNHDYGTIV